MDPAYTLEELLANIDESTPSKTYAQLLAEGRAIPRWLAEVEQNGTLFDIPTIH